MLILIILVFIVVNFFEFVQMDILLLQYLVIQEKGVFVWEFELELEIVNCFVEVCMEIEFFDLECIVMSNLLVLKQNEVYYWEVKIYEKLDNILVSIGMCMKFYLLFWLLGRIEIFFF